MVTGVGPLGHPWQHPRPSRRHPEPKRDGTPCTLRNTALSGRHGRDHFATTDLPGSPRLRWSRKGARTYPHLPAIAAFPGLLGQSPLAFLNRRSQVRILPGPPTVASRRWRGTDARSCVPAPEGQGCCVRVGIPSRTQKRSTLRAPTQHRACPRAPGETLRGLTPAAPPAGSCRPCRSTWSRRALHPVRAAPRVGVRRSRTAPAGCTGAPGGGCCRRSADAGSCP